MEPPDGLFVQLVGPYMVRCGDEDCIMIRGGESFVGDWGRTVDTGEHTVSSEFININK